MVKSKSTTSGSVYSIAVVLFVILHVALKCNADQISYDDFLQCIEDAVTSEVANENKDQPSSSLEVSKLPHEILLFMNMELYENRVVKDFATTSRDELTKILTNDIKLRKHYFEKNKEVFKFFLVRVLEKDLDNYPKEKPAEEILEMTFLSLMPMAAVDEIIETTITKKNVTLEENWKVLTLKDSFRTIYFYCKYPNEMSAFLTQDMRDEVREWLDIVATWGKWGFGSDDTESNIQLENNDAQPLKIEL